MKGLEKSSNLILDNFRSPRNTDLNTSNKRYNNCRMSILKTKKSKPTKTS